MNGLFYWQKICLAYQGDTKPCDTPCNHCARIAKMMMQEFEALRLEVLAQKGAMLAVCETAGGYVEGHFTGPHNILGRIRELVEIERRYLFPSQMDRYPEGL